MTEYKPKVGNISTVVRVDMQEDISKAVNIKLKVLKPDLTNVVWTPVTISGTTFLEYTIRAGDFNLPGLYWITPSFRLNGWEGDCQSVSLLVSD